MSLLWTGQDTLILHLKQLSSFWGVLYTKRSETIEHARGGDAYMVFFLNGLAGRAAHLAVQVRLGEEAFEGFEPLF